MNNMVIRSVAASAALLAVCAAQAVPNPKLATPTNHSPMTVRTRTSRLQPINVQCNCPHPPAFRFAAVRSRALVYLDAFSRATCLANAFASRSIHTFVATLRCSR